MTLEEAGFKELHSTCLGICRASSKLSNSSSVPVLDLVCETEEPLLGLIFIPILFPVH